MNDAGSIQGDLFALDSPLLTEVRGERSLMAFPFFALSKGKWTKPLAYKTDAVSIEIVATSKGVATIYDKEVLLYIASLMVAKLEAGVGVSQDFYFTAHDLFRVTGVNGSARSYARLSDALERLQGTQIKTNIEAGGEGQAGFFSWLSEAQLHYTKTKTGDKRLKAVKVRLCDWLYRAILRDRRVLDYAPSYFQLGPIERRLYEVARSACVHGAVDVDLDELRLQLGYQSSLKHFRYELKRIADENSIPGFTFDLLEHVATSEKGRSRRNAGAGRVKITPRPLLASA
ncbi:replication initiator protein A [Sphingobium sp.]|mgnify:FL=1|jgi:plasmid replication initiation protein|uniref:replication initiator protein A n=1 Tax=Sphingobium sp. TaxID=1912891 RepID=UPI000C5F6768|nr:replication initiator protein A [Sphingobium sp.]MAX16365.1 RepA family protein [Sphingobium sp.]MBS86309.1 RepA family protein [Sphingobium sp.]|tara:strand:- start:1582 stop:2442 length:861 start_codon:yes stop_codon:yes gene_type:complete